MKNAVAAGTLALLLTGLGPLSQADLTPRDTYKTSDIYKPTDKGCKVFDYDTTWIDNAMHTTDYTWSGPCVHGYAEGAGELRAYMDGNLDEITITPKGGMVHGKLTGRLHTEYRVDEGDSFAKGSYDGTYVNGRRNGHGEEIHSTGESYSGNFQDGHRSGPGVYRFADGSYYEGASNLDRFTGLGKLVEPDGSVIKGIFVESDINGPCTVTWPNGTTWTGQCINTQPQR